MVSPPLRDLRSLAVRTLHPPQHCRSSYEKSGKNGQHESPPAPAQPDDESDGRSKRENEYQGCSVVGFRVRLITPPVEGPLPMVTGPHAAPILLPDRDISYRSIDTCRYRSGEREERFRSITVDLRGCPR